MSIDENIYRAARFRRSITENDEIAKIAWIHSSDFQLDRSIVTVRMADYMNRRIYAFECVINKKGCDVGKLIEAQHSHMKQVKRLDRNIFVREQQHRLGWITPVSLATKEIVCFKPSKTSLSVVRISDSQVVASSLTTYINTWETFVEMFECRPSSLYFCCILEINPDKGWLENKLFLMFIEDAIGGIIKKLKDIEDSVELQPYLPIVNPTLKLDFKKNTPSWSEEHLRLPKCSQSQKLLVYKMKEKFPDATDNSLIRYLMAKSWDIEETTKAFNCYLAWKQQMKKYSMSDFKSIMKKKILTYVGKDYMGRPIVYNKAAAVVLSEQDEELYLIFYNYFFDIYIVSKMEGYVDKILVITDGEGLGFSNFKFSLTKKNLDGLLKYCPERQSKLIGVHANWFGEGIWKMLKPLLPKKTVEKIVVLGNDKQKILDELLNEMDVSVVPECLGGKNKTLWADC